MQDATLHGHEVPTFLVERYWPGVTHATLVAALERLPSRPEGPARHLHSILIPGDEVVFSVFEGVSLAQIQDANRRVGAPFERVVEARMVMVGPEVSHGR